MGLLAGCQRHNWGSHTDGEPHAVLWQADSYQGCCLRAVACCVLAQVYVEQVSLTSLSYTALLDATNASTATAYVGHLQSNASVFSAVINPQLAQFGISQQYAPFATPAQLVRLINITSSSLSAVQNGTVANPQWLMAVNLSMNLVRGACSCCTGDLSMCAVTAY
jgi:hypothetical protein